MINTSSIAELIITNHPSFKCVNVYNHRPIFNFNDYTLTGKLSDGGGIIISLINRMTSAQVKPFIKNLLFMGTYTQRTCDTLFTIFHKYISDDKQLQFAIPINLLSMIRYKWAQSDYIDRGDTLNIHTTNITVMMMYINIILDIAIQSRDIKYLQSCELYYDEYVKFLDMFDYSEELKITTPMFAISPQVLTTAIVSQLHLAKYNANMSRPFADSTLLTPIGYNMNPMKLTFNDNIHTDLFSKLIIHATDIQNYILDELLIRNYLKNATGES